MAHPPFLPRSGHPGLLPTPGSLYPGAVAWLCPLSVRSSPGLTRAPPQTFRTFPSPPSAPKRALDHLSVNSAGQGLHLGSPPSMGHLTWYPATVRAHERLLSKRRGLSRGAALPAPPFPASSPSARDPTTPSFPLTAGWPCSWLWLRKDGGKVVLASSLCPGCFAYPRSSGSPSKPCLCRGNEPRYV